MRNSINQWKERGKEYAKESKFNDLVNDILEESREERFLNGLKKPSELYQENVGGIEEGPKEAPKTSAYVRAIKNQFKKGEAPIVEEERDLFKNLDGKVYKRGKNQAQVLKEDQENRKKFTRGMAKFLKGIESSKLKEVESLDNAKVDGDSNALLRMMGGERAKSINGYNDEDYEDSESYTCQASDEEHCDNEDCPKCYEQEGEDQENAMEYEVFKKGEDQEDQQPSQDYSVEALYRDLEEIKIALESPKLSKEEKEELKDVAIKVKKMLDGEVYKGTYLSAKSIEYALDALDKVLGEGFSNYTKEVSLVESAYMPHLHRGLRKI